MRSKSPFSSKTVTYQAEMAFAKRKKIRLLKFGHFDVSRIVETWNCQKRRARARTRTGFRRSLYRHKSKVDPSTDPYWTTRDVKRLPTFNYVYKLSLRRWVWVNSDVDISVYKSSVSAIFRHGEISFRNNHYIAIMG